jgi:hypothetical protein
MFFRTSKKKKTQEAYSLDSLRRGVYNMAKHTPNDFYSSLAIITIRITDKEKKVGHLTFLAHKICVKKFFLLLYKLP